ncbi:MAG: hypothetical protein GY848_18060 [Methyloversatilis sp.]|jgi:hypothetical protein|uniref:Lipoprotein n=1 Tax=Methyloversatilis universalis (strain ATCC BAA-1314 / DSM 25237 / JCM 13912 / CCUG 52030 / FAM5) TaxID=1000565 RepID=F5RGL4_METUF|nr:hypothetical protein [Methyloversatilis universalis]EGK70402.1 hypothetical protein METUNv1_03307 [Methyloversatilis universalis FAM5]MCP4638369.1 hypothetical protein [Methyloversatilis sp.]
MMNSIRIWLSVSALGLLGAGCSNLPAPHYTGSIENVQRLKATPFSVKVGRVDAPVTKAAPYPISLRASPLISPYENSFGSYLAEAIRTELKLAGRLSPDSEIEITGTVLRNDIDVSGFSVAFGDIEARFVVMKGNDVRYDQVKSAHHQWESAFAGAIAIPQAVNEYPRLVQKLLATLYADSAFLNALQ